MALTKKQKYAAAGAVAAAGLLVWWLWPKKAIGRRKQELTIDADVYSPTFGEPIYGPQLPTPLPGRVAVSDEMQRLIDQSNAAIAADDAENRG